MYQQKVKTIITHPGVRWWRPDAVLGWLAGGGDGAWGGATAGGGTEQIGSAPGVRGRRWNPHVVDGVWLALQTHHLQRQVQPHRSRTALAVAHRHHPTPHLENNNVITVLHFSFKDTINSFILFKFIKYDALLCLFIKLITTKFIVLKEFYFN